MAQAYYICILTESSRSSICGEDTKGGSKQTEDAREERDVNKDELGWPHGTFPHLARGRKLLIEELAPRNVDLGHF